MKAIRESEWFGLEQPRVKVSPHATNGLRLLMRVVFAGTPEVAVPALDAIAASDHELVGVVTRPDAPSGRGRRLTAEPGRAARRGARRPGPQARRTRATRSSRPPCARSSRTAARSSRTAPCCRSRRSTSRRTAGSTCTSRCCPHWRGAAPVQHAIWNDDEVTGATTFRIVKELDAGPTFGVMTERIRPDRHLRRPAGAARRGRCRAARRHPRRDRGRLAGGPRRSRPRASRSPRRSSSTTPASTGPAPPIADRLPGPRLHAGARRLDDVRRRAGQARPGRPSPTRTLRAGRARGRQDRRCWSAPAPTPYASATCKAYGKKQMAAADWARGLAARGRRRFRCARSQRRGAVDPARLVAFEVLKAVRVDDAYTNLVLPALLRQHGLSGRDAAFATELASGTIRWQGTYDAILAACIDRPLSKVESKVLDALRLGTHQLLAMRVPTHAAISTTVDLVRDRVSCGCRRLRQRGAPQGLGRRTSPPGSRRSRPTRPRAYSHPRWVVDELRAALGARRRARRAARRRQRAAEGHPGRPPGTGHARRAAGRADAVLAVRRGAGGRRPRAGPGGRRGPGRRAGRGLAAGRDRAAAAPVDGADARWLDLCAGPGGKAALLAALAAERGAGLVASERQPHRAAPGAARAARRRRRARGRDRRRHRAAVPPGGVRPGAGRRAVHRAGRAAPPPRGALAAPAPTDLRRASCCSSERLLALGARPDPARAGSCSTRPARRCSPRPAGVVSVGPRRAATTSGSRTSAPLLPGRARLPPARSRARVQLWPHRHGTDAMFLALLRKR